MVGVISAWCFAPARASDATRARFQPPTCSVDDASRAPPLHSSRTRSAVASIAASILVSLSTIHGCQADVLSQPLCYKGEGPGCDSRAQENQLIRELLEKSRQNRQKNDQMMLEKYWRQGYGDYFSFGFNKELVKDDAGNWSLVDPKGLSTDIKNRLVDLIKSKKK